MCSTRGENRERLIVTDPMAARTPMIRYQHRIAASAMAASEKRLVGLHSRLRVTRRLARRAVAEEDLAGAKVIRGPLKLPA
jgi:hypothetical protein